MGGWEEVLEEVTPETRVGRGWVRKEMKGAPQSWPRGDPTGKAAVARENLVLASLSCEFTWGMKAGERGCGGGGVTSIRL